MRSRMHIFGKATLLVVALLFFSWSSSAKMVAISGSVRCNGKGVAGVVVSDGVNVVVTNGKGAYKFTADTDNSQFVHISIPSGYEAERTNPIPKYFVAIDESADKQTADFNLTKVDQSRYTLMTMADTHILGGTSSAGSILDVERYTNEMIPAINDYAAKLDNPVYMVHLGDIGLRTSWKHRRGGYTLGDYVSDTKVNMPLFNVMGNHDHNIPAKGEYFEEHNIQESRKTFHELVGPSYYSFNIGREHYIVVDNTFILTKDSGPTLKEDALSGYQYRVDERQMAWMVKDMAALNPKKVDKVVVLIHCPILSTEKKFRMIHAERFLNTFKGYDILVLAGHSHVDQSLRRTYNDKELIQNIHASSAGTFWYTPWSCDGTPGGAVAYHFGRGNITRDYVAWGEAKGKKYLAYDNVDNRWKYRITKFTGDGLTHYHDLVKAHPRNPAAILVNIFGAYKIRFTESTGGKGESSNNVYDLNFRDWHWSEFDRSMNGEAEEGHRLQNAGHQRPRKGAPHTCRYIPKDPKATITVEAEDVFGNIIASFELKATE